MGFILWLFFITITKCIYEDKDNMYFSSNIRVFCHKNDGRQFIPRYLASYGHSLQYVEDDLKHLNMRYVITGIQVFEIARQFE